MGQKYIPEMLSTMETLGEQMERAYREEFCEPMTGDTRAIIDLRIRILQLELDKLSRRLGPRPSEVLRIVR